MAEQSTAVQYRGGTTTEHSSFIGLEREVTVDITKKTLVVHDGLTAGGYPLAKSSELNNGLNAVNLTLNNKADVTYVDTNITTVTGKINTEKARIDAILTASSADKDSFAEIVTLINSVDSTNDTAFAGYVTSNNAAVAAKQPLDADLTAIAGLTGTSGILKKTAADTWTLDTNTYVTSSGVTSITASAPLTSTGGFTPTISINAATSSAAGSMSAADKTKLDGIATGANNYVLPTATSSAIGGIKVNANTQITAANAVTTTTARTYAVQIDASGQAVVNVPWVDTDTIYSHPTSGVTAGTYKSVTVNAAGHITAGTNPTTLAGYGITDVYTKTEVTNAIQAVVGAAPAALDTLQEIATQLASDESAVSALTTTVSNKVDKVAGKQLSTEDYTTAEKTKLAGIATGANNYILPNASSTVFGGIKVSATTQTVAANAVTTTTARTYAVQIDASGNALVNVPWVDTNTIYTHPTSGITAGTYKSVTVDVNGHITTGTNPTTLAGYGITDAATISDITTLSNIKLDKNGGVLNGPLTGVRETAIDLGSSSIINLNSGNYFSYTALASVAFSVTNAINPTSSNGTITTVNSFILELTNGGSNTITWWSGVKWPGGVAPTLTASGVDILGFVTKDGGVTWRGMLLSKDSK